MADKQDNRSEQWLQDYARHRREQQGSAPKMHDATRRVLQDEVQRTWGQTVPAEEISGGLESWLLKFATGTVAMGALALGVWVISDIDNESNSGRETSTGSTMKMTQADPTRAARKSEAAERQNTARASMYAQHDKEEHDVAEAKKYGESESTKAPRSRLISAAMTPRTISSPRESAPPQRDIYSNMRRNFSEQVRFARNEKSADKPRAAVAKATQQEVMQDFEVVRSGNVIQVRDKDGSIYKGRVILASASPMMAGIPGTTGPGPANPVGPGPANPVGPGPANPIGIGVPPVRPPSIGVGGLRPVLPREVPGQYNPDVPNDNVETPMLIVELNKPLLGHNMYATRQGGNENDLPNFHGRSVWFKFLAQTDGVAILSTRGSNFDTTLGVFRGNTPATIVPTPDVDDQPAWNNDQPNAPWSEVSFPCEAGVEYRVAVDGVGGSTGQIKLTTRFIDATGTLLSAFSARKVPAVAAREANGQRTLFYFQVAGTNRTSGQPVKFEGFMHNAYAGAKKDMRLKDPQKERTRSVAVAPLRIQGRASYGSKRLTVDALTASIASASASKSKRREK